MGWRPLGYEIGQFPGAFSELILSLICFMAWDNRVTGERDR
jgi:hypothetical protein